MTIRAIMKTNENNNENYNKNNENNCYYVCEQKKFSNKIDEIMK